MTKSKLRGTQIEFLQEMADRQALLIQEQSTKIKELIDKLDTVNSCLQKAESAATVLTQNTAICYSLIYRHRFSFEKLTIQDLEDLSELCWQAGTFANKQSAEFNFMQLRNQIRSMLMHGDDVNIIKYKVRQ